MPTYEYICDSCRHKFERFQPITAKPIRKCPKCEKRSVRRLITGGAGLIFKGSGFYQTDYRSKKYQEAAKKDSGKKDSPEPPSKKSSKDAPVCGPSAGKPAQTSRLADANVGKLAGKQPDVCFPDKK